MWGKKQQLEPDMEKLTGSKLGEEYIKPVNRQPSYLTYMQSTSCETLGWMNHKLESKLPGHINNLRYADDSSLMEESKKNMLIKVKEEWKSWHKTQHSKNEDHGICSHHFMANRWGKSGRITDFIFLGSKMTVDSDCSHENKKDACSLEEKLW